MRFSCRFLAYFFIAFLSCASTTPAWSAENGEREKITIAQFGKERFLLYLPLYVAMEEGLFAKRGLNIDLKFAGNDDQIFAAVISGGAQFGMGDPVFTAISHDKGGPGKVVAMMITKLGLSGVGNVTGSLLRASPVHPSRRQTLLLRGGVVGFQLPSLSEDVLTLVPGDTLLFATDGVHPGFAEGLLPGPPPQEMADRILAQHFKGSDDALVLVARFLGAAA